MLSKAWKIFSPSFFGYEDGLSWHLRACTASSSNAAERCRAVNSIIFGVRVKITTAQHGFYHCPHLVYHCPFGQ